MSGSPTYVPPLFIRAGKANQSDGWDQERDDGGPAGLVVNDIKWFGRSRPPWEALRKRMLVRAEGTTASGVGSAREPKRMAHAVSAAMV